MTPTLLSIQVGLPRTLGTPGADNPMDRPWTSGFFKEPVNTPVRVTRLGIVGDGVADRINHGGPDKAVLAYSADHYPGWSAELGISPLPFGAFGENLTVSHLTEDEVCVGDVWACGELVFEVSQPRQPCWKLARRWRVKDLPARVVESGRSGWYLRVLVEGEIVAGLPFTLTNRPNPDWTVRRAHRVMHFAKSDSAESEALMSVPGLSFNWAETLRGRVD
jgi:MOSC domain-containing protein YiiM